MNLKKKKKNTLGKTVFSEAKIYSYVQRARQLLI